MKNEAYAVMIAGIAKPGMENYVKNYLSRLMQASRKQAGCLIYNIHQSNKNPAEFMVYMLWENKLDFEVHNQSPEMQEFKHQLHGNLFTQESPKTFWQLI